MAAVGLEVFGMSEARIRHLNAILDSAFKLVVSSANFCMSRVYVKFGIHPLYSPGCSFKTPHFDKKVN